ncbi:MAG: hypothetical protein IKE70_00675 [Bacilli bacterium]|nr:hypothetical protein [Bacilli bacterium]
MTIKLNKNLVEKMVKNYYHDEYDVNVDVKITSYIKTVGYYEDEICDIKTVLKGKRKLYDEMVDIEIILSDLELRQVIRHSLEKEGYEISNIELDKKIEREDYFNHTGRKQANFHGVRVELKEKVKKIGGLLE